MKERSGRIEARQSSGRSASRIRFLGSLLVAWMFLFFPMHMALGQDVADPTVEVTQDSSVVPTAESEGVVATTESVVTETPSFDVDPTREVPDGGEVAPSVEATESVVVEEATETATTTPEESQSGTNPDASPTEEATPTESPTEIPALLVKPDDAPQCQIAADSSNEGIEAGGEFTYDCTFGINLGGTNLERTSIQLNWEIIATSSDGWPIQLLAPTNQIQVIDSVDPNPVWTDSTLSSVAQTVRTLLHSEQGTIDQSTFAASEQLDFSLRLTRPLCVEGTGAIDVFVSVTASVPDVDGVIVNQIGEEPVHLLLNPVLAPYLPAAPTVVIQSVAIDPVPFSLSDQSARGVLILEVTNPARQCQDWNVRLSIQGFAGLDFQEPAIIREIGALQGESIPGYVAVSENEQFPAIDLVVSQIPAGVESASYTQVIGFDLVIPGQVSSGSYESQISVHIELDRPLSD